MNEKAKITKQFDLVYKKLVRNKNKKQRDDLAEYVRLIKKIMIEYYKYKLYGMFSREQDEGEYDIELDWISGAWKDVQSVMKYAKLVYSNTDNLETHHTYGAAMSKPNLEDSLYNWTYYHGSDTENVSKSKLYNNNEAQDVNNIFGHLMSSAVYAAHKEYGDKSL